MEFSSTDVELSIQTDNLTEEVSSSSSSSSSSTVGEESSNSQDLAYEGFPYESNFLELSNGLNMHYLDEGSGDPIVLLHGPPTSSFVWRNIIPELAERGRVIVPDLINFGLSDTTEEPLQVIEGHGSLFSEFIDTLGLENITFIGQDWGGPVELTYAVDNPDNVKALAFFESPIVPFPDVGVVEAFPEQFAATFWSNPELLEENIIDNNLFIEGWLFDPAFGGIANTPTEAEQEVYREPFLDPEARDQLAIAPRELPLLDPTGFPILDPDGVGGNPPETLSSINDYIGFANYLATTEVPKLLIYGNPGFASPELVLSLAQTIPGFEIQEIGDADNPVFHFIQEDAPEELSTILGDWYDTSVVEQENAVGDNLNSDTITLEITIENLAPQAGIGIAQTWYGFHDGSFDLYNSGEEASRALEILAEDGITGIEPITPGIIEEAVFFGAIPANFPSPEETVAGEFSVSPAGLNGGTQGMLFTDNRVPPFFLVQNPGETVTARVTIDRQNIANNRFFNYGAMLFPTNDGFFANDDPQAIEVFDEDGNFLGADISITGDDILDAGTEVNDENPDNVIYELDVLGNSIDENGTIQPFPGFLAPGENGVIDFEIDGEALFTNADFTVPDYSIANISITQVDDSAVPPTDDATEEPSVDEVSGVIDFEGGALAAGTIVTNQFTGVEFSTDSEFGLMLFDSDNPTGGDTDLGATGVGNVLIISEDGNSSNPDDNAAGGTIDIEFDELTQVNSIGLLDIDEPGSSITLYGENSAIIETREIPSAGDNSLQELTFERDNVASLEINLAGSGALTELNFADI